MKSNFEIMGEVDYTVEWIDGTKKDFHFKNTILNNGRRALANALVNNLEGGFNYYITQMVWGDGGTSNGVKRVVEASRNGLFGVTRLSKPVVATINETVSTQAIFTAVIKFDDAVGVTLNEMALQMADGDFYSMATFADLNKTSEMQITFNWKLNII